jgi:hypothetical protein
VSVKAGRWIPELRHELFPARSESFSLTEMFEEKTPLPKQETVGVSTNYCIVFFSPGSCHDVEPCIMRSARAAFFFGTVSLRHATQRSCQKIQERQAAMIHRPQACLHCNWLRPDGQDATGEDGEGSTAHVLACTCRLIQCLVFCSRPCYNHTKKALVLLLECCCHCQADDSFADSSDRKSWWFWLILDETYRIGVV